MFLGLAAANAEESLINMLLFEIMQKRLIKKVPQTWFKVQIFYHVHVLMTNLGFVFTYTFVFS